MRAEDVREVLETILPNDVILKAAEEFGLQQRERKLDVARLLRAMVMSAATGYGGRQADVLRMYLHNGAPKVVRGAFYRWFGEGLEKVMKQISDIAIGYAKRQPVDLPGWLGEHVRDWHIVDSSTVQLDDSLQAEYPGAGDYAAVKVHKRFSVGIGAAIAYHLSPAREHDSKHLKIDESWKGLGLLADLGYVSLMLLQDCDDCGVSYCVRLKENWKPKVNHIARGTINGTLFEGADLDVLLDREILLLDGRAIDADVTIGGWLESRLVAVDTPKGYCFYLTNLPPSVGPRQIADLYRIRWEIESDNKLDKSCSKLDRIQARTGASVRALIHASMISSMIMNLLAHHHRIKETRPARQGQPRTTPPIHPQSLGRALAAASNDIAWAMEMRGLEAERKWAQITSYLEHLGQDPNWRSRPSVLDQLRGWQIAPGRPRKMRAASFRPTANGNMLCKNRA